MTVPQVLMLLVIAGIIVAIVVLRRRRAAGVQRIVQSSVPKIRAFLERTGYAFADARGTPPQAQAERWEQLYRGSVAGQGFQLHWVRNFRGLDVHWEHRTIAQYRRIIWSESWWAPVPAPPRVPLHVSERSNTRPQLPGGTQHDWQPAFPRVLVTGDHEIDQRFVVYGLDDQAVRAVLANATFRQALLRCAYVDLRVLAEGVRFSDPTQNNATAALGGAQAAIQFVADPGGKLERTQHVHEQVAELMYGALMLTR